MELYRQRCDNLGTSLASCQAKLEDERYCGDLTTEVNKLRKLLAEEKKKVGGENARLGETHALFEQIYLDYNTTMESVKQAQHEKRMKVFCSTCILCYSICNTPRASNSPC